MRKKITYSLFDRFDSETQISSMARTTGYTCTAVARLILEGKYTQAGISPPEFVGKHESCFNHVLRYLQDRNIHLNSLRAGVTNKKVFNTR